MKPRRYQSLDLCLFSLVMCFWHGACVANMSRKLVSCFQVPALFGDMCLDTRGGGGIDFFTVAPCCHHNGSLRTFWHTEYFTTSLTYASSPRLPPASVRAIQTFDEIASEPGVFLEMQFEPGDIQLVNNHVLVHSRTRFEDGDAKDEQRHLLRLWLSLVEEEGWVVGALRVKERASLLGSVMGAKIRAMLHGPGVRRESGKDTIAIIEDEDEEE